MSESLEAVDQLVHSTLSIDAIIRRALDVGSEALGAGAASVELREGGRWIMRYQRGLSPDTLWRGAQRRGVAAGRPRPQHSLEPVVVEDARVEPELNVGILGHYGVRGCVVVPLVSRGEVEGCLLFHYTQPHRFSSPAIDYAKKFGSAVSLALENARLRERERESIRVRTSLSDGRLGRIIAQSRVHPIRVLLVACVVEAPF